MQSCYSIFGQNVCVNFDSSNLGHILTDELSLYPKTPAASKPDLIIDILSSSESPKHPNRITKNPLNHIDHAKGFIIDLGSIELNYKLTEKPIIAEIKIRSRDIIKKFLAKAVSVQFTSVEESVGQILHEWVLVPLIYLDEQKFLVHASAICDRQERVILLGGAGGVGKTSLATDFCMNRNFRFAADDIAIVSSSGYLCPNLAFPKIYGYNLKDNRGLKQLIFEDRTLLDKLFWNTHYYLRGANKVRRRVSPKKAYGYCLTNPCNVSHFFILFRESREDLEIERVDAELATLLSLKIMRAEYSDFNKHILWHEYNYLSTGREPMIVLENIFNRWQKFQLDLFKKVVCYLVRVPADYSDYIKKIADLIELKLKK